MNWLQKIFSGSLDGSRVNWMGVALMAIGVILVLLAPRIAEKVRGKNNEHRNNTIAAKLIGLIICAAGTLIAILA